ncbi:hypothetical protein ACFC58_06260 [Kitasatospora purpeofusca]|uniref:hypothetical protein n=1 Tax=Kitasatospora purpeofusca TaxID=67352 RepID=UPI0035DB0608
MPDDEVLLSLGLGADSVYVAWRLLSDPVGHGLREDLSNLTVVTSMTGDEWSDTIDLSRRFLLPLLAEKGVRYVQVARGGRWDADGYVVLSDTRHPVDIEPTGPWTLSDELRASGTLPMYSGGKHVCSIKYKGWVIDNWAADHMTPGYRHIIGYDADETGRARKDSGFTTNGRRPWYPLIAWQMSRPEILAGLRLAFGVDWPKSYCVECPFPSVAASREAHLERARRLPSEAAMAVCLEWTAHALNPLTTLYAGGTSLAELLAEDGNQAALAAAEEQLASVLWTVVRVRRVLTARRSQWCVDHHGPRCEKCARTPGSVRCPACRELKRQQCPPAERSALCSDPERKGRVWRSVESIGLPRSRAAAAAMLRRAAGRRGLEVEEAAGVERVWLSRREEGFPTTEQFFVAVPNVVEDKAMPGFHSRWTAQVARRTGRAATDPRPAAAAAGRRESADRPDTTDTAAWRQPALV